MVRVCGNFLYYFILFNESFDSNANVSAYYLITARFTYFGKVEAQNKEKYGSKKQLLRV